LLLKRVKKDIEQKGMELEIKPEALDTLVELGYDPEFGARPMRRAIQDYVDNKLAEILIAGKVKRRDKIIIGEDLKIMVESAKEI